MKNKYIILLLNVLLVIFIGLIIGITFRESIFNYTVRTIAFVLLLITICAPAVIYIFLKNSLFGTKVVFVLFIIAELIINILFLSVSSLSGKALAISQAVVVSTLLISLIIIVSLFKDEK